MKKFIVLTVMLFAFAVAAQAQTRTPKANARQARQTVRIAEGAATGDLTRRETRGLVTQQRHINRTEARMKADGVVTPTERARLNKKQNRANRNIRRQKNDGQTRGGK